jgi:hypothetical protein
MTKGEEISAEAKAAETKGDLWSLFFRDAMLDKIVRYTNEKINETMEKQVYNEECLRKQTHFKLLDKVVTHFFLQKRSQWVH